ncbi:MULTISPECIES: DUF2061 domain-containing protein [Mesorhizobium]|uniref:Membrane protein n=1 Tax=Mesorhizobium shonense TaxID=1209948 RepID=A0ABV2HP72_9HYPH|nr:MULTISPECIES: DUF2061 domain-containing protein [unclassified Mesorhizobium]AZO28915.1 DUF2061 domain-containing protein [Mesorhizobium sp. M1B.F.Ca.ET.045.04.1.1]RWB21302.1 MAG: DUF2061 domain-containing protein [Mesorhizobium sp.]RWE01853.1 MAG: DUF2061 domain-containing protein [Mesorhizobium sp.]TIS50934.1 MAG: DUF2061 domain-containing protein [Mesorhizobium sp.]TIT86174.1 MAG: DUF2061 domain-containing protein [Mesorhizobium sp.]
MDTHSRSFIKALSWRATGTVDTMIISLVITGSVKLAAAIGGTEVVTKSLLFYLHERAWLKIPFGMHKKPASSSATEAELNPVKKS